jgi:hypothetical protein
MDELNQESNATLLEIHAVSVVGSPPTIAPIKTLAQLTTAMVTALVFPTTNANNPPNAWTYLVEVTLAFVP